MRVPLVFLRAHWLAVTFFAGLFWLFLVRIYYWAKPSLPELLRLVLRRWWARRRRVACRERWPILESAGHPPEGWSGWPAGSKFALVLTHDVESRKGLERVKALAELEMELGLRSSFNFIPEGPYQVAAELRQWLVERGFEVGVHDHRHDGHLFKSHSHFVTSAKLINCFLREWNAVGFRSGYMFHNLAWIEELKVLYDSSTFDTDPFEPQPDGVNTIFPFWVQGRDGRGYVELPYTLVQDSTLFVSLQETTSDIWKRKLEWIAARGGMALLNAHPDYIAFERRRPQPNEFPVAYYTEFLEWLKRTHHGQYWHALPREVAQFCRQQSHK